MNRKGLGNRVDLTFLESKLSRKLQLQFHFGRLFNSIGSVIMANLPILQFEEKIVETVEKNPVVVIIGETGSGKSTQLSQILHRHGYTKSGVIAITQPRRVAAVSVAR